MYDAVTTRVFPKLAHDRMALKLNGKDDKLRRADFRALANTAGLRAAVADRLIDTLSADMEEALDGTSLPSLSNYGPDGHAVADQMLELVGKRLKDFS